MSLSGLPVMLQVAGRPVILVGEGEAADAKRRILERAGAEIVGETEQARLAVVIADSDAEACEIVERLHERDILVNAVDRPDLCDFIFPSIVERDPVIVAISTGGASAGLAAALRQRLEGMIPAGLGTLATRLGEARATMRQRWPDAGERRRVLSGALMRGGKLDPMADLGEDAVDRWLESETAEPVSEAANLSLRSEDPDELTVRQARLLANADYIVHTPGVPAAILHRARADAVRIEWDAQTSGERPPGLTLFLTMAA
ncbi:siroheme synthase [Stakelama sp. CBK3Z-3]|uniref:precorrin-2 dehydrogenase n=1 Tax=Stakelama flava TaxID=2860338 RepID=A0ABS6XP90_9SPHN|nr:NAD(P)-dependent oxidoreductase [Stakelama flava]MBW4331991.1 siroheme synthase [Stakelama flava]